jgi:hypothetical protein
MLRRLFIAALGLLLSACSKAAPHAAENFRADSGHTDASARIVPEGLSVTALAGGNGVLELVALTLQRGPGGVELFAALENVGDTPACNAAFSVELFDQSERSLAAGIGGLHASHYYRLTDGSDAIASCVGPGDVSMVAVTDLPSDIAIEEVGTLVYRCPYFALDVAAIAGLAIRNVKRVTLSAGMAYMGTLVNELDVTVNRPSVAVFPVDRAGRPLAMLTSSSSEAELPPGGSWAFETNAGMPGEDYYAYPAGALQRASGAL